MRRIWVGVVLVVVLSLAAIANETLDVYFINVGHGDAILIDCGDWEALLDAGRGYSAPSAAILAVLAEHVHDGIIELAILSHPHADHYGGFEDVFDQYDVSEFWRSLDTVPDTNGSTYSNFLVALADEGLVPEQLEHGAQHVTGPIEWSVFGPGTLVTTSKNDNENSLVLLLTYGNVRFLFVGDIAGASEAALYNSEIPIGPLVLKVAHHGSDTSTSSEFLAWASPDVAVISGDADDLSDRVAANLDGESTPYQQTSLGGTIHISTDGDLIWLATEILPVSQVIAASDE